MLAWQRQIHEALTAQIEALRDGATLMPLWGLLLGSFAYGVFHVLAPGHGKVIVSSYFLGNHARWKDGVIAGLILAIGHTVTAIAIVVAFYFLLGLTQMGTLANARYVELAGYGLITMIGFWLLLRAAVGKTPGQEACCGHDHHHHDHAGHHHAHAHGHDMAHTPIHKNRQALGLFAATSLAPCTGSMIILFFTMANQVLWAGILAVGVMALGMWLTVTAIGIVSIFLRRMVIGDMNNRSVWRTRAMRALGLGAACMVVFTGGMLFLGTLQSVLEQ